jgi:hypothetical protein
MQVAVAVDIIVLHNPLRMDQQADMVEVVQVVFLYVAAITHQEPQEQLILVVEAVVKQVLLL